ncbi:MAG: hypothetical protein AB7E30_05200 [Lawsonibacter sp.]
MYNRVTRSTVWNAANAEQRTGLEADLYNLIVGNDAGIKLQEKMDGGAAYGLSETDYLLYLTAREMVDENNKDEEKRNGSIDQGEAKPAIDMLVGCHRMREPICGKARTRGGKRRATPTNKREGGDISPPLIFSGFGAQSEIGFAMVKEKSGRSL